MPKEKPMEADGFVAFDCPVTGSGHHVLPDERSIRLVRGYAERRSRVEIEFTCHDCGGRHALHLPGMIVS